MEILTVRCRNGWCLKDVPWERLQTGEVIINDVRKKLYSALCKLKNYEDTELSPDDVERSKDFEQEHTMRLIKLLAKEMRKHEWISAHKPPMIDDYVLLSFANFSPPLVGRYKMDDNGCGAYYVGNDDETCISQDLYVNGWMKLPKPYRPEETE